MSATDPRIAGWAGQILTAVDDSIAEGILPATVRSFTDMHDHCDANDFLIDAGVPYDGTEATIELTVAVQDAVTAALRAPDRPWCTHGTCRFPGHDHTTTQTDDGTDLDTPAPMRCTDCGQPAHYDTRLGDYRHDNPAAPDCFLIHATKR
ncbi:hypothetical protein OHA72_10385 [Dactylosporangium sp. NBC_01737]|uniref:hypothetical protein n=1 Tax=Dactylosporangium sp. NBC_01737 TaxID=2975959 RepID=UPI002E0ECFF4|nr:hypothetical protein OHA72_10385 [Dactylosporangium sp. NBC_01737]